MGTQFATLRAQEITSRITIPAKGVKVSKMIIDMVSCMCDNKSQISITIDSDKSTASISGMGNSLSNYQFKHSVADIQWEIESGEWLTALKMIESGTSIIASIKFK